MISTKKPPRPCFSTSRGLCKVGKLQIPVQKLIIKSHRGDRMIFARNTSVLRDSGSLFSARLKFEGVWTQFESKVKFWLGFISKFGARDLQSESEIRGEKDIVMARLAIFRIENSKKNIRMPWRRGSIYGVQYSKIVRLQKCSLQPILNYFISLHWNSGQEYWNRPGCTYLSKMSVLLMEPGITLFYANIARRYLNHRFSSQHFIKQT